MVFELIVEYKFFNGFEKGIDTGRFFSLVRNAYKTNSCQGSQFEL